MAPTKPLAPVTRIVDMAGGPSGAGGADAGRLDRDRAGIVASTRMTDLRTEPLAGRPLRRLVEAMPKAELHLHLDGSLRIDTALELARTRGVDAPRDWAGMCDALIAPMPCADQAELLRAFDLPIALMQDAEALERIAAELVETKAADGVRYVEIRWGPLLHVARRAAAGRRHRRGLRAARGRGASDTGRSSGSSHGAALARPGGQRRRWPRPRPGSATTG